MRLLHVEDNPIDADLVDQAAANILRIKFRLGLFDRPYTDRAILPPIGSEHALATARRAALRSGCPPCAGPRR